MNNERRKKIKDAILQIANLVQNILSEEEEAYENMISLNNQMTSEEAQGSLEAAIEALEDAMSCLEEI